MKKRISRRHVRAWLEPIRKTFSEMLRGEVDSLKGYAVTRLNHNDEYARIDYCIAGFKAVLARLCQEIDASALDRVERKLANGTPLFPSEIQDCFKLLKVCENSLVRKTVEEVKDAVLTEQIQIELDELAMETIERIAA